MPPLNSLTPEQKAQIPRYREKWRSLLFSTKRIERSRARGALKAAYLLAGQAPPEIYFFPAPQALQAFQDQQSAGEWFRQLGNLIPLGGSLSPRLNTKLTSEVLNQIHGELFAFGLLDQQYLQLCYFSAGSFSELIEQALSQSWQEQRETLRQHLGGEFFLQVGDLLTEWGNRIQPDLEKIRQEWKERIWQPMTRQPLIGPVLQEWEKGEQSAQAVGQVMKRIMKSPFVLSFHTQVSLCALMDCCSALVPFSDAEVQYLTTLRSVVRSCGFVAPFENLCLVVERPTQILRDEQGRFPGGEVAAVTFADGSQFYPDPGMG
ncbi:MAG: hypothetical protein GVY17_02155 [Cyanobacteria bacterium]|jgi:hypothetical protein|nr:hypothetical protein [Cyanobacteria bacterium GSL.Bin21]